MAEVVRTPAVDAFLAHHGVLGQKWGVRKGEERELVYHKKLKSGVELNVVRKNLSDYGRLTNYIASKSPTYKKNLETMDNFRLQDKDGKHIGDASFDRSEDGKTFYLDWLGIDKSARGQGYARATMEGVIKYAQDSGVETLSMTATKMGAPLYESLGFKPSNGKSVNNKHVKPNSRLAIAGDYTMDIPKKVRHVQAETKSLLEYVAEAIELFEQRSTTTELAHSFLEKRLNNTLN